MKKTIKRKPSTVRARLNVYEMSKLNKKQIRIITKWLDRISKEMNKLEVEAYVNNPRFTLYK